MDINRLYGSFFRFDDLLLPYTSDDEMLNDLFSFLDLCFTLVSGAKGFSGNDFPESAASIVTVLDIFNCFIPFR